MMYIFGENLKNPISLIPGPLLQRTVRGVRTALKRIPAAVFQVRTRGAGEYTTYNNNSPLATHGTHILTDSSAQTNSYNSTFTTGISHSDDLEGSVEQ